MDMFNNLYSKIRGSGTQTVQIDNPPRLPTLRLVLTSPDQSSSQASSNNHSLQTAVNFLSEAEKAEILQNLNKRGHLTEEEMNFLNTRMEESLQRTMSSFIEEILKLLEIKAEDSSETAAMKEKLLREVYNGLKQLFRWVLANLEKIMEIENPKLRNQSIKKLFEKMEGSLSDCIGSGSMPETSFQPGKHKRKDGMYKTSSDTAEHKSQVEPGPNEHLAGKTTNSPTEESTSESNSVPPGKQKRNEEMYKNSRDTIDHKYQFAPTASKNFTGKATDPPTEESTSENNSAASESFAGKMADSAPGPTTEEPTSELNTELSAAPEPSKICHDKQMEEASPKHEAKESTIKTTVV